MSTLFTVFPFPAKFQRPDTNSRHPNPTFLNLEPKSQYQLRVSTNLKSIPEFTNRKIDVAHQLLDKMVKHEKLYQRFILIEEMINEGFLCNGHVLNDFICGSFNLGGVNFGLQIHSLCLRIGLVSNTCIRSSLITMYLNYRMLDYARKVLYETSFSEMDEFSVWGVMISELISHECYDEAFRVFDKMISSGVAEPNEFIYARVISACSITLENSSISYMNGSAIHGRIVKQGLEDATHVWNSLVKFYAKCGTLKDAMKLFDGIYNKDVVSWNTIISSCEQHGDEQLAIDYFRRMVNTAYTHLQPNQVTFISVTSAVSGSLVLNLGKEVHARIIRLGFVFDTSLANCVITMYSKCKRPCKSRIIFDSMIDKDLITWNAMLSGYQHNEQPEHCFCLFSEMLFFGIEPDSHTYTVILSAASLDQSIKRALSIHAYILKNSARGDISLSVSNALLAMYAKFNRMEKAEVIFMAMKKKDLYSWNAIMDGYSSNGKFEKVFGIFSSMLNEGLRFNHLSFSILLTCCGRLVSLHLGKQVHSVVMKLLLGPNSHSLDSVMSVNNGLVSMYSKCGSISDANQVFCSMKKRDVFSWTAMITGFAHHGLCYESIELYDRMKLDGVKPNHVTFLGLLLACVHGGLVKHGVGFYNSMTEDYNLKPGIDHYACLIDLFARSGQFDQAKKLAESGISIYGNTPKIWKVLLGACHAQNKLKLGIEVAKRILELDPLDDGTLVILANLYSSSGLWDDALRIRDILRVKGLKKEVGYSWLEVEKKKHKFVAGDIYHPRRTEIYEKLSELDCLIRRKGYLPMTELVLHDVDDEAQKEAIVGCHSEKLAVTFGILQNRDRNNKGVIRVIKNLRVCGDCHKWMKYVSEVEGREIILRDSRRFHHFKNGRCSCRDFW